MSSGLIFFLLVLPLIYSVLRGLGKGTDRFLFNAGETPFLTTLGSAIAGNIGIGTFVALFLFASQSVLIGAALAIAYMIGLLLCAAFAPRIHHIARASGQYGLINFLIFQHGIASRFAIWVPFAVVFGLRTLVQLMALALIVQLSFGLDPVTAMLCAALGVALYTSLGGYQAATQTDAFQAIILLCGVAFLAAVIFADGSRAPAAPGPWHDLGPFGPELLVGIAILFPFSTVLSVDNWHRIATSDRAQNARRAYIMAAVACSFINGVIVWLGYLAPAPAGTSAETIMLGLRDVMPLGQGWIADAILVVAVMSSIDTFTMPLIGAFAGRVQSMVRLRLATFGFFAVLVVLGLWIGDILQSVVAAFNSVVVFLPAVFGALFLNDRAPQAALLSCGIGVAATIVMTVFLSEAAGLAGFAISFAIYAVLRPKDAQR